jgi:hypothetical protein
LHKLCLWPLDPQVTSSCCTRISCKTLDFFRNNACRFLKQMEFKEVQGFEKKWKAMQALQRMVIKVIIGEVKVVEID